MRDLHKHSVVLLVLKSKSGGIVMVAYERVSPPFPSPLEDEGLHHRIGECMSIRGVGSAFFRIKGVLWAFEAREQRYTYNGFNIGTISGA